MNSQVEQNAERGERLNPNLVLNDYLLRYVIQYALESNLLQELESRGEVHYAGDDSVFRMGALNHLAGMGYVRMKDGIAKYAADVPDLHKLADSIKLVDAAAELLMESKDRRNETFEQFKKRVSRESGLPRAMAFYAGHALMLKSYDDLTDNAWGIETGSIQQVERLQPHNARGSGTMLELASAKIAQGVVHMLSDTFQGNEAILAFGAGNGQAALKTILTCEEHNMPIRRAFITDINPETRNPAFENFVSSNHEHLFTWMQLNMMDADGMKRVAHALRGWRPIILIDYILHEEANLANQTMLNIRKIFPHAMLVLSEYFWQSHITEKVPLWFQTIHQWSGQQLFTYREFMEFVGWFGYREWHREIHNDSPDPGEPMNATLYLTL